MIDESIKQSIDELGKLNDELIAATELVARLKNKVTGVEDELRPLLTELENTNTRVLEGTKYTVAIIKRGYEAKTPKYKTAFDLALKKVNGKIRKILEDTLEETTTTRRVLSKMATQKIDEAFGTNFTKLILILRKSISNVISKLKRNRRGYEQEFKGLVKLLKQM